MDTEVLFQTIDRLFDENKPKEAERYMLSELELASSQGRTEDQLVILNELIGYYRQTSEVTALNKVIDEACGLAEALNLDGTVPYATTLVNAANAYRSMGELDRAGFLYEKAEEIYSKSLDANDMLLAGLYNNMSLFLQERGAYDRAEEYQLKSLEIAVDNDAGFEIAVSHANLANTYLAAQKYDQAIEYATKAISLFEARGLKDPHYCAALSALANCYLVQGDRSRARALFTEASNIVEDTFGRNSQYLRLQESIRMCGEEMNGMTLAKAYYEEHGRKMLEERFPEYIDRIAVGLAGEGSDCFGYDDELSRDHDFGPDFCMWVSDETYEAIGEALAQAYEELPDTYKGVKRQTTAMGYGRRGVIRISDYYKKFLGTDNIQALDWNSVEDYSLAACVNGEVWVDEEGVFSRIREELLRGYPESVLLARLASDVATFSQCGQYNYERMMKRGDTLTARIMLGDYAKATMKLFHHMLNVYPPHDKWLAASTRRLGGGDIVRALESTSDVPAVVEQIAGFMASSLYERGYISDIDTYLDHHIAELLFKSNAARCDNKELVDKIARLEFTAFDKVQNEGGRASCQNDWPTFSVMRKSQYLTWNREMLLQYYYDFNREYEMGHNLITEKYGRMMESTAPDRYAEIKDNFPELSQEKKTIIEEIVRIQMSMVEQFATEHPGVAANARTLHTAEDAMFDTSYETYLRGEISTYSDKMLQLYAGYVISNAQAGNNIARMTIENTAKLYGFKDLEAFEASGN